MLYEEELSDQYAQLLGLGLQVRSQSSLATEYVERLRRQYARPSTNDLFALALPATWGVRC